MLKREPVRRPVTHKKTPLPKGKHFEELRNLMDLPGVAEKIKQDFALKGWNAKKDEDFPKMFNHLMDFLQRHVIFQLPIKDEFKFEASNLLVAKKSLERVADFHEYHPKKKVRADLFANAYTSIIASFEILERGKELTPTLKEYLTKAKEKKKYWDRQGKKFISLNELDVEMYDRGLDYIEKRIHVILGKNYQFYEHCRGEILKHFADYWDTEVLAGSIQAQFLKKVFKATENQKGRGSLN